MKKLLSLKDLVDIKPSACEPDGAEEAGQIPQVSIKKEDQSGASSSSGKSTVKRPLTRKRSEPPADSRANKSPIAKKKLIGAKRKLPEKEENDEDGDKMGAEEIIKSSISDIKMLSQGKKKKKRKSNAIASSSLSSSSPSTFSLNAPTHNNSVKIKQEFVDIDMSNDILDPLTNPHPMHRHDTIMKLGEVGENLADRESVRGSGGGSERKRIKIENPETEEISRDRMQEIQKNVCDMEVEDFANAMNTASLADTLTISSTETGKNILKMISESGVDVLGNGDNKSGQVVSAKLEENAEREGRRIADLASRSSRKLNIPVFDSTEKHSEMQSQLFPTKQSPPSEKRDDIPSHLVVYYPHAIDANSFDKSSFDDDDEDDNDSLYSDSYASDREDHGAYERELRRSEPSNMVPKYDPFTNTAIISSFCYIHDLMSSIYANQHASMMESTAGMAGVSKGKNSSSSNGNRKVISTSDIPHYTPATVARFLVECDPTNPRSRPCCYASQTDSSDMRYQTDHTLNRCCAYRDTESKITLREFIADIGEFDPLPEQRRPCIYCIRYTVCAMFWKLKCNNTQVRRMVVQPHGYLIGKPGGYKIEYTLPQARIYHGLTVGFIDHCKSNYIERDDVGCCLNNPNIPLRGLEERHEMFFPWGAASI